MVHQQWICLVFCVSFPLTDCQSKDGAGLCMPPNSEIITCCAGYIREGDKCIECETGFAGENCSLICPPGYYGRQCEKRCFCSPEEYCEPKRGCLCNTSSVQCKDREQKSTTEIVKESTVSQSHQYNILPSLVFAFAVLIIGTICIRMLYAKVMKKRRDNLAPCLRHNSDASSQQNVESININCHPLHTVSQRIDEEMGNNCFHDALRGKIHNQSSDRQTDKSTTPCKSTINPSVNLKRRQQKNAGTTFLKSVHGAASLKKELHTKLTVSPAPAYDKELYSNQVDLTYTNKSFRPDSPMNK